MMHEVLRNHNLSMQSIVELLAAKELSARELTYNALENVKRFDQTGPCLRALSYVNPRCLEDAERLDIEFEKTGRLKGPLHGLPIIVKDNFDLAGVATAGGCKGLMHNIADSNSRVVEQILKAGGIIIGKSNMHELALGGLSVSSGWDQVRNPYDLSRTPGGSSGGSAVALIAGYGVAAIGTDTVNSIRSPASATGLVGLRPTRGLVSRAGLLPVCEWQDAAGPITRTVQDAAYLLNVLKGFDARDQRTAEGCLSSSFSYADRSKPVFRIGTIASLLGNDSEHDEVNKQFARTLDALAKQGVELINITDFHLTAEEVFGSMDVQLWEFKKFFNDFLKKFTAPGSVSSLKQLLESGHYLSSTESFLLQANEVRDRTEVNEYLVRLHRGSELRLKLLSLMQQYRVDALLYPHQKSLVAHIGTSIQPDRNGIFAAVTGLPAVTVCAGMSQSTMPIPIGIELLGKPFDEATLCALASIIETISDRPSLMEHHPLLSDEPRKKLSLERS